VLVVGVGLAVAQPGDLGDDDEGATATTLDDGASASGETTSSTEGTTTKATTTTTIAESTTTTVPPTTTTTVGSSVSGAEVEGGTDGDLADSGGESLAIPALGLAAAGLALGRLRRASRPS
jgi:hypothetical protein